MVMSCRTEQCGVCDSYKQNRAAGECRGSARISTGFGGVFLEARLRKRVVVLTGTSPSAPRTTVRWAQAIAGDSDSDGSEHLLNELGAQIYDFKCWPRTATPSS
ncbi:hypothetical protein HPB52_025524 [Rhipicephalus sanguineus]|uniref:Uncharacterized protein n=1 Tax=Rhipicephalus sanguineus TaxID=34632 RepID=A0A9D4SMW1_RHISA|nr:hypothetical protein HPB52_025524 [Rhipicephalus sanguineus]